MKACIDGSEFIESRTKVSYFLSLTSTINDSRSFPNISVKVQRHP